jgi:hypothetical protein
LPNEKGVQSAAIFGRDATHHLLEGDLMAFDKCAFLTLLALLPWTAAAQTKAPAKASRAGEKHPGAIIVEPSSEKWGDVPASALVGKPSVEMGGTLRLAIIQGDPMTPGRSYTLRLSCTDGLKVAPHWHPATENVTVMKGTVAIGMGSKWDDKALEDVPTGGFASAPAQMRHFALCKGDTILQVHGIAPFVVNFVTPDDTPPVKKP